MSDAIDRARSRLDQFRNAPDKHASYAAKVLLKFKLLEFQQIKLADFLDWGHATQYLQMLSNKYAEGKSFDAWFFSLCKSLEKSGACTIVDEQIININ